MANAQQPSNEDQQAPFAVSPSYIAVSLTLGDEGLATEFTLESQADVEITVSISSEFSWIVPSLHSVNLLPTESVDFSVTVLCTEPGSSSGLFVLESTSEPVASTLIPVQRSCQAPSVKFETLQPLQDATAAVGYEATASLVWRVVSVWDGHAPIDFSVSSSPEVTTDTPLGSANVNEIYSTTVRYQCEREETLNFFVLLSFDKRLLTWEVECQEGIPGVYPDPPVIRVIGDAGTEESALLTLINDYEHAEAEATDYSLSTSDSWLTLLQTAGSMPSPSKDYVPVMVTCDEPGTDVGEITLTSDSKSDSEVVPQSYSISIIRECLAPSVEVRLLNFDNRSRVGIGQIASVNLDWLIRSTWLPKEGLEYTVLATGSVAVDNATGVATRDRVIRTPLQYACGDTEENQIFEVTVSVGSTSQTFLWHVSCLDPPLGVIVDRDSIKTTLNMAKSIATGYVVSFRNILESEVILNITGTDSFILPSSSSKTIEPLGSAAIAVTLTCSRPGRFTGQLELRTSTDSLDVHSIPVELLCTAPAFSVVFNELPPTTFSEIPNPASSTLVWSLQSYWSDITAIDFSLKVEQGVSATNTSGSLQPNVGTSTHSLEYQCRTMRDIKLPITLEVGGETHGILWHVECVEPQSITRLTLSFLQGPLVASLGFEPRETDWELVDQHKLDPNMIAGRDTIVEIEVEHTTSRSEPVQLSLMSPEKSSQEVVSSEPPIPKGSRWLTRSSFFLNGADVLDSQAWEIEIPAFGADDSRSRLTRTFLPYLVVQVPPSIKVRFIPIETDDVPSDPDIETIVKETIDYLPFGQLTSELAESRAAPDNVGTAEELAAYLITLWQEDGADPLTLYHGLYTGTQISPELCGLGEVGGNVAVSKTDLKCTASATATHEIGHNLSLQHAPCGVEANGTDESFPYTDGSIGTEFGYFTSERKRVESDHDVFDIMSYCTPTFISQYYFSQAARNLLERRPAESPSASIASASSFKSNVSSGRSKLIFSGTVNPHGSWDIDFISRTATQARKLAHTKEQEYVLALYAPGSSMPVATVPFELKRLSHTSKKLWSVVMDEPIVPTSTVRILNVQGESLYELDTIGALRMLNETNRVVPIH